MGNVIKLVKNKYKDEEPIQKLLSLIENDFVRVNNLIIGGIRGHVKGSNKKQDDNFVRKFKLKVPLRRLGEAQDIPSSVIFLSSSASSYITGSSIVIDGGYSIL